MADDINDDDIELLGELGVETAPVTVGGRTAKEQRIIAGFEEIAQRNPCRDFAMFKPLFEKVQQQLASGERRTIPYKDNAETKKGGLFILDGQKVIVAEVEIVATFKLANINRKKLEALLHRFFGKARLDVELKDRFGEQVEPREWFLVPLGAIEETIQKLMEGTLGDYQYDPEKAAIVRG